MKGSYSAMHSLIQSMQLVKSESKPLLIDPKQPAQVLLAYDWMRQETPRVNNILKI